ncbi:hypothetical protein BJ508DRAFT_327896 [Ascobolus immersus RN42]|uniref:Uncharacterized protein n=1 Tax=Ascobolus immersus RN42 TaxID=1160509 RepID=A0A3N4I162_ASCIM|nr:hypothetical protein BJ508DRAFT_327896 [Ascobolus immersus RN42]
MPFSGPNSYQTNNIKPEQDARSEMSEWNFDTVTVSTNTAIGLGHRPAGTGTFRPDPNFGVRGAPGADEFMYRGDDVPRGARSVFANMGTAGASHNYFLAESLPGLSDGSTLSGGHHLSTPRTARSLSLGGSTAIGDSSYYGDSGTEQDSAISLDPDYTPTLRYQFEEYPVPCLFGFTDCPQRFTLDISESDWRAHVETHLVPDWNPPAAQCLYDGCRDYSYHHWDELLSHVFTHFLFMEPSTATTIDIFPDAKLLSYCKERELIGSDTYQDYMARIPETKAPLQFCRCSLVVHSAI